MVFSDTTNKDGVLQMCETYLALPDGAITGDSVLLKKFTSLVNMAYDRTAILLWMASKGWDVSDYNATTIPVVTKALTTSRNILIDDPDAPTINLMKLKRVDVSYDGTNWYRADNIDTSTISFGMGDEDNEDNYFLISQPKYTVTGNLLGVFPRATADQVSAGAKVRLEFTPLFTHFESTDTDVPLGFDEVLHDIVPLMASMKYSATYFPDRAKNIKVQLDEALAGLRGYFHVKHEERTLIASSSASSADYA